MIKQWLLVALIMLILISAQTIDVVVYRSDIDTDGWYWDGSDAGTRIIIGFDQEQWQQELQALDYDFSNYLYFNPEKDIPILVYLGECPSGGYRIVIKEIAKRNDETIVKVVRRSPQPGEYVSMNLTYPYDYLLLQREALINDNLIVVDQYGTVLAEYHTPFPNESRVYGNIIIYSDEQEFAK